jgi:hypothetical protein
MKNNSSEFGPSRLKNTKTSVKNLVIFLKKKKRKVDTGIESTNKMFKW